MLTCIGDRARYNLVKPLTASGDRIHEARATSMSG